MGTGPVRRAGIESLESHHSHSSQFGNGHEELRARTLSIDRETVHTAMPIWVTLRHTNRSYIQVKYRVASYGCPWQGLQSEEPRHRFCLRLSESCEPSRLHSELIGGFCRPCPISGEIFVEVSDQAPRLGNDHKSLRSHSKARVYFGHSWSQRGLQRSANSCTQY